MKKFGGFAVLAATGVALTACGPLGGQVEIMQGTSTSEHVLGLSTAACGVQLNGSVEETPTEVVVTVTAIGASSGECSESLKVELEEPLADRAVVDGSTGEVVEMYDVQQPS